MMWDWMDRLDWGWIIALATFLVATAMLLWARWNAVQAQHLEAQRDDARAQRDRLNTQCATQAQAIAELHQDLEERVRWRKEDRAECTEWQRRFEALNHVYEEAVRQLDEARKELDARPVADPHKTAELPTPPEQQYEVKPRRSNGRKAKAE